MANSLGYGLKSPSLSWLASCSPYCSLGKRWKESRTGGPAFLSKFIVIVCRTHEIRLICISRTCITGKIAKPAAPVNGQDERRLRAAVDWLARCPLYCYFSGSLAKLGTFYPQVRAQKRDYQFTADSPSFVVTFRLLTAQFECSSILPYWVSGLLDLLFYRFPIKSSAISIPFKRLLHYNYGIMF